MRLFGRSSPVVKRIARRAGVEGLEGRILFHLELVSEIPNSAVAPGTTVSDINLAPHFDNEEIDGTIVRLNTDVGNIDIELFDSAAPQTVANFLGYVTRGDFNNTVFHRAISNFIVQAGGYQSTTPPLPHVPQQAPVVNEFSPTRSNVRGTVAMAKVGGNPNSATSEFFFNLENNSSNLDNQNGGFTVFGRVINDTMAAVDSIAGLQKSVVRGLVPNPPGDPVELDLEDFPLLGGTTPSVDTFVGLNIASTIAEAGVFNYQVTSSDPELVTPVIENGVLRLNYGAGRTGTAEITVTATDADGTVATDTFTAGVGVLDVAIGTGGARAATFTDADGTVATISLKGGAGSLRFTGANLSQTTGRSGAVVQGTITDLSMTLTGTGTTGALSVRASGGDGLITVNGITCDAGMRSIAAKQVNLVGDLTIAGNVAKADFADVANSIMTFGGAGGSLALSLRAADAVDIVSQIAIKSLKATSFTSSGPDSGVITAPAVGSLQVTGDFNQRLNVSGPLGSAKIGGAVSSFLPWNVAGAAGKLSLGSVSEGFVADFLGPVSGLSVTGNLAGDISALSIRTLAVKGDLASANLILTGPGVALGRATVTGAITNSRIQATNSIGGVTAGSINSSTIYAGVNTDGGILPNSLDDFSAAPAAIASITIRGGSGAATFANSNIAARTLGRVSLGVIQAGNNGVPFGVAGDTIASVAGSGVAPIKLSKLIEPGQTTAQQDFTIQVL